VWAWDMSTPQLRATMRAIMSRQSRLPIVAHTFEPELPYIAITAAVRSQLPRLDVIEGAAVGDVSVCSTRGGRTNADRLTIRAPYH